MQAKAQAARAALKLVRNGMTVGLGTGSTAAVFIEELAARNRREHLDLTCVATSIACEKQARALGLHVAGLGEVKKIDLAVDGADQVDRRLNLIKGGGGAHAREKVVDYAAAKFVVIAVESKLVARLAGAVPLEILPFALPLAARQVQREFGAKVVARKVLSDNGLVLADAHFKPIANPGKLEAGLCAIPGIAANGIFSRNVHGAFFGSETGARWVRR
ncbi:MAG: ribose-5-phosphate isomerase RpiA [Candidatus Micrarchaeota archaeon]